MESRIDLLRCLLKEAGKSTDISYSATMRELHKKHPDKVRDFMTSYKQAFDQALIEKLEDAQQLALMEAIKTIDFKGGV